MAKSKSTTSAQPIEDLQARYQELAKQKIVAETDRKHAVQKLESLKSTAREKYGSDDLEELQRMLEDMTRDNEQKRAKYQTELERIETELARIDAEFGVDENAE